MCKKGLFMQCRLCLKEKKLCKSHIFPEFFYKSVYDDNHGFIKFSTDKNKYNSKMRKGFYEQLLCKKCEEIIQSYEDHGKLILYEIMKPLLNQGANFYNGKSYNYKKFKLFILSLIWRASITSRIEFSSVKLGKYEENLRSILLNNIEVKPNIHPILIAQGYINSEITEGIFVNPSVRKFKNNCKTTYTYIIDSIIIMQMIGDISTKAFSKGASIRKDGIFIANQNINILDEFIDTYNKIKNQGKFIVYENT